MDLERALLVVGTSLLVSMGTELLSWLLVYRTSNYRRFKEELDRHSTRLESFKQQQGGPATKKEAAKKEKRLEDNVKTSIANFNASRMKANMATGLINLLVIRQVMSQFEGVPVARLPFEPFGWVASLFTHRGLPGTDLTECSSLFLYLLCTMFLKLNIPAACGWSPSRASERLMRLQQQPNPDKYK